MIEGALLYIDLCHGRTTFRGREEIGIDRTLLWRDSRGDLLWHRGYTGGMSRDHLDAADDIYKNVLVPALLVFPRNEPWVRGPAEFRAGDFLYTNEPIGDMRHFANSERIVHVPSDETVYLYEDHGGFWTQ